MIFITVKSDLLEAKRQFETDKEATKYLSIVKRLHVTQREWLYSRSEKPSKRFDIQLNRTLFMKSCLPLKVSIYNTDNAQYNLKKELV